MPNILAILPQSPGHDLSLLCTSVFLLKSNVLQTIQYACTSLEDTTMPYTPTFPICPTGPEWVEQFVGFSRRMIALLGRVTGMVAQRSALLRAGTDCTAPGKLLRAQAERLVVELGDGWNWDELAQDLGKSNRVQRGSEVSTPQ